MSTKRQIARADRILHGLWRLRLPLPWPGVPHVNAWAISAGSGVVLVDTGLGDPGALAQLELGLREAGLRLRAHPAARLHARAFRPLRPGGLDRRRGRLRAVDAPQPRAHDGAPRRPGKDAR